MTEKDERIFRQTIAEMAQENTEIRSKILSYSIRNRELQAQLDAVVECKNIILACLNRERKTMTDHIAAAPTCEALDKALAAIEALKQPDSGEQEK